MVALILADRVQQVEPELLQEQPVQLNQHQVADPAELLIRYQMQPRPQMEVAVEHQIQYQTQQSQLAVRVRLAVEEKRVIKTGQKLVL